MTDWSVSVSIVLGLGACLVAALRTRSALVSGWIVAGTVVMTGVFVLVSQTGVEALDQVMRPGRAISPDSQLWLVWGGVSLSMTLLLASAETERSIQSRLLGQMAGLSVICGSDSSLGVLAGLQVVVLLRSCAFTKAGARQDDPRLGLWMLLWTLTGWLMVSSHGLESSEMMMTSTRSKLGTVLLIAGLLGQLPPSLLGRRRGAEVVQSPSMRGVRLPGNPLLELGVHASVGLVLWRLVGSSLALLPGIDEKIAETLLFLAGLCGLLLGIVMCYRARTITEWANTTWLSGWGPMLILLSLALLRRLTDAQTGEALRAWPEASMVALAWVVWLACGISLMLFLEREYLAQWRRRGGHVGQATQARGETRRDHVDAELLAGWGQELPTLGVSLTLVLLALAGAPLTWGFWQMLLSVESMVTLRTRSHLTGLVEPLASSMIVVLVLGCVCAAYWKGMFGWLVALWAQPCRSLPGKERFRVRALTSAALAMTMVLMGLIPGPMLRLLVRCQRGDEQLIEERAAKSGTSVETGRDGKKW